MKQSEVLKEFDERIAELEKEVVNAQAEFDKFHETTAKIDDLNKYAHKLSALIVRRKEELATPFTRFERDYATGYSHYASDELVKRIQEEADTDLSKGTIHNAIWEHYCTIREKDKKLKGITDAYVRNRSEMYSLQDNTTGYESARTRLQDRERDLDRQERRKKNMSDLSNFRQWAKDQKQRAADDAAREREEKAKQRVRAWVEANLGRSNGD